MAEFVENKLANNVNEPDSNRFLDQFTLTEIQSMVAINMGRLEKRVRRRSQLDREIKELDKDITRQNHYLLDHGGTVVTRNRMS